MRKLYIYKTLFVWWNFTYREAIQCVVTRNCWV